MPAARTPLSHAHGGGSVLRTLDPLYPRNWIGDKGCIGNEMITPSSQR